MILLILNVSKYRYKMISFFMAADQNEFSKDYWVHLFNWRQEDLHVIF